MKIEVIRTIDHFKQLQPVWNELLINSGSDNIHLRFEWLSEWLLYLGKKNELCILKVTDQHKILGIVPLMVRTIKIRRVLPLRQVVFLGYPESDFADFIIVKNRHTIIKEIFKYINNNLQ